MGEYVKYNGNEVKIGTCELMYYCSYQKFKAVLEAGKLSKLDGNAEPDIYIKPESQSMFRFPFPDEDHFRFGEIIEPFNRGIPIMVNRDAISVSNGAEMKTRLQLLYQKPVAKEDGSVYLALVYSEPDGEMYSVRDDNGIKQLVEEIIKNNILAEPSLDKKVFYTEISTRILEGYNFNEVEIAGVLQPALADFRHIRIALKSEELSRLVMVHPRLTADPLNAQGKIGTVQSVELSLKEITVTVKFDDGKVGKYQAETLHTLYPIKTLYDRLLFLHGSAHTKKTIRISEIINLIKEGKSRLALEMTMENTMLKLYCTTNYQSLYDDNIILHKNQKNLRTGNSFRKRN